MWSSAARLDARKKGKQSGIAVVVAVIAVAVIAVAFALFKLNSRLDMFLLWNLFSPWF